MTTARPSWEGWSGDSVSPKFKKRKNEDSSKHTNSFATIILIQGIDLSQTKLDSNRKIYAKKLENLRPQNPWTHKLDSKTDLSAVDLEYYVGLLQAHIVDDDTLIYFYRSDLPTDGDDFTKIMIAEISGRIKKINWNVEQDRPFFDTLERIYTDFPNLEMLDIYCPTKYCCETSEPILQSTPKNLQHLRIANLVDCADDRKVDILPFVQRLFLKSVQGNLVSFTLWNPSGNGRFNEKMIEKAIGNSKGNTKLLFPQWTHVEMNLTYDVTNSTERIWIDNARPEEFVEQLETYYVYDDYYRKDQKLVDPHVVDRFPILTRKEPDLPYIALEHVQKIHQPEFSFEEEKYYCNTKATELKLRELQRIGEMNGDLLSQWKKDRFIYPVAEKT